MTAELIGAWEEETEGRKTFVIFSAGHLMGVIMNDDWKPFHDPDNVTPGEAKAAYGTFKAQGGPYTLDGSNQFVTRIRYDLTPNWIGEGERWEYKVEGDVLHGQVVMADGSRGSSFVFKRLS